MLSKVAMDRSSSEKAFTTEYRQPSLFNLADVVVHVQLAANLLHVGGEAVDVFDEIRGDVVGVVAQLGQGEAACVVELIAGKALHRLGRIGRVLFKHIRDRFSRLLQSTLKPAHDRHGDDDIAIFIGHIGAAQFVCNAPDKVCLRCYVYWIVVPENVNSLVFRHWYTPHVY